MLTARPVLSSISTSAPCSRTRSFATSNRTQRNRVSKTRKKVPPFKIPPSNRRFALGLKESAPLPRRAGRIIERAQEPFLRFEQGVDFFLIPEMVATGDDVHAGSKDF